MAARTIVMDNGAATCKTGYGGQAKPMKVVKNAATRTRGSNEWRIFGEEAEDLAEDLTGAQSKRPHDHGYVVNWELQRDIWNRILGPAGLGITPADSCLLLTDPLFNPPPLRDSLDQSVFEQYQFHSYYRITAASLALRGYQYEVQSLYGKPCAVIVDLGHSFTHVVPMFNYVPVYSAVKRCDIGGKHLTRHLQNEITKRHVNLNQSIHVAQDIKEKLCYVSTDCQSELDRAKALRKGQGAHTISPLTARYVLPDNVTRAQGSVLGSDDTPGATDTVVTLGPERFTVPELYFRPSLIGLDQCGIAEALVAAVTACDPDTRAAMLQHIILVGGGANFPAIAERLESEVRGLVADDMAVRVAKSADPLLTAWCGGSCLSIDPQFNTVCVTKAEYEEHGKRIFDMRKWQGTVAMQAP